MPQSRASERCDSNRALSVSGDVVRAPMATGAERAQPVPRLPLLSWAPHFQFEGYG